MHRRTRAARWSQRAAAIAALTACALTAQAQSAPPGADTVTLKQAFDAAWARQPEALALPTRRAAARAQQRAASAWTPEPAALELSNKTDHLNRNQGVRELEVGLAVPIWLPGERSRSTALADAEEQAVESRASAAQLRVSAAVRESWWQWQRARAEADAARDQLGSAQRIAADVARRLKAGDLARADQHQADGAVATAEAVHAHAQAVVSASLQQLRAGTGLALAALADAPAGAEAEPAGPPAEVDTHAALLELRGRATVAERSAALTASRTRANPELTLAVTRDRGGFGESERQTLTLGVRIPFGGGARHEARNAGAQADAVEAQTLLALERDRLLGERESARARVDAARAQLAAADRRLQLARESRGFFDKSFRHGETDLPTRLRIELEATDAERQAARSRIELAAAISSWRQALGLVPQ